MSKSQNKRRKKYWKRQAASTSAQHEKQTPRTTESRRTRNKIIMICVCCACILFAVVWLLTDIEIAAAVFIFLGAAALIGFFAYTVASILISAFVSDYRVYRNGDRYAGTCTGTRRRGKADVLVVEWEDNDIQHSVECSAFRKLRRFPYPVTVYYWKGKANLGLYTLFLDVWYLVLILPAAVFYIIGMIQIILDIV